MLALLLTIQYCVLNSTGTGINGTLGNASSMQSLMQFENSSPCLGPHYTLGFGFLGIIMLVAFALMAIRVDIFVAGAVSSWIGTGVALLLIQLSLLGPNAMGLLLSLAVLFTILALLKGGLNPY